MARWTRGESVTALSSFFGVSRPTIYRVLEKQRKGGAARGETRITIRLEASELAALDELSSRMNISRSALGRKVLRLAVDYVEPDDDTLEAIRDLSRQIKAVGGNLNQIAAHLNREARMQGEASVSSEHWKSVKASQRDLKAFARQIDDLFLYAAKRRRARNADILRKAQK